MPATPDQFTNFGTSIIAYGAGGAGQPLLSTDTELTLRAGDGALLPASGPFPALLGTPGGAHEVVKVTARASDVLTIVRAQEGTTAQPWAIGTPVTHGPTAGSLANLWSLVASLPFNVMAYGAKGDGVTDDTAAIQAAINAAAASTGPRAVVYFPPGHYMLSASLIVDTTQISLVGGGEEFTTQLEVLGTVDPTWALIVGNTASASYVSLFGLTFKGRNTSTSTGGGILFRCTVGSIKQCRVVQFGGHGIEVDAYNSGGGGQIFDVLLDDVYLVQNGNSSNNSDQLSIGPGVYDSEFCRVICEGGNTLSPARGRYGINTVGHNCKFYHCHEYYNVSHGFSCNMAGAANTSCMLQVIGGEHETNGGNNLDIENCQNVTIIGASCYGAVSTKDVLLSGANQVSISGCLCESGTTDKNVAAYNCTKVSLIGNVLEFANAAGLDIDSGCTRFSVMGNTVDSVGGVTIAGGTYCVLVGNTISQASIVESAGADYNQYVGNDLYAGGAAVTIIGTHSLLSPLPASASAAALAANGTISTAGVGVARIAPAANVTGIVLQAGVWAAQHVSVVNESAFTVQFAASGSQVADGASDTIPALSARGFVWDTGTALWYRLA